MGLFHRKKAPIMPVSLIPSFLAYCFFLCITPGPANLCILSTALRYGKKAALRQWRGLFTGYCIVSMLSVLTAYFLGSVLDQHAATLSWVGAAYLLWMAWRTLRSPGLPQDGSPADSAAPGFLSGMLVNLTNVKVILYCLTALSTFVLPYTRSFWALLAVGLFLPFTGPMANFVWLFAGTALQKLFVNHRRAADILCAAALALCAVSLVLPR